MTRRSFLQSCIHAVALGAAWAAPGWARGDTQKGERPLDPEFERLEKPSSEWRDLLPPDAFRVLLAMGLMFAGWAALKGYRLRSDATHM